MKLGPKDIEKNQVVLARRDTGEKEFVALADLEKRLPELLEEVQQNLYNKALQHRNEMTTSVTTMEEFTEVLETKGWILKSNVVW